MNGRALLVLGGVVLAGVAVSATAAGQKAIAEALRALGLRKLVHHRDDRGAGVDPQLLAFLDAWDDPATWGEELRAGYQPFAITVIAGGGVRTSEADQRALYLSGVSQAATLAETPHARRIRGGAAYGQALDLGVYERASNGLFAPAFPDTWRSDADNARLRGLYAVIGRRARRAGLTWGGDWKGFPDLPHIETKDWRALALVRNGGNVA